MERTRVRIRGRYRVQIKQRRRSTNFTLSVRAAMVVGPSPTSTAGLAARETYADIALKANERTNARALLPLKRRAQCSITSAAGQAECKTDSYPSNSPSGPANNSCHALHRQQTTGSHHHGNDTHASFPRTRKKHTAACQQ